MAILLPDRATVTKFSNFTKFTEFAVKHLKVFCCPNGQFLLLEKEVEKTGKASRKTGHPFLRISMQNVLNKKSSTKTP